MCDRAHTGISPWLACVIDAKLLVTVDNHAYALRLVALDSGKTLQVRACWVVLCAFTPRTHADCALPHGTDHSVGMHARWPHGGQVDAITACACADACD
jgi:hypothetical protein